MKVDKVLKMPLLDWAEFCKASPYMAPCPKCAKPLSLGGGDPSSYCCFPHALVAQTIEIENNAAESLSTNPVAVRQLHSANHAVWFPSSILPRDTLACKALSLKFGGKVQPKAPTTAFTRLIPSDPHLHLMRSKEKYIPTSQ